MKYTILLLALILFTACANPKIIQVNNTVKEILIINNSVQCETTTCLCSCPPKICVETKCDTNPLKKCNLLNARLIGEVKYYKNLTISKLQNVSYEELEHNYTECRDEVGKLKGIIGNITESLE